MYTPISLSLALVFGAAGLSFAAPAKKPAAAPAPVRQKMMVPPPPPHIPMVRTGEGIEFSTIGVPLDLMGTADLQNMKKRLEQSLETLSKRAEERDINLKEARERVEQFDQLFVEGVVSKRDVRNAKKDLAEIEGKDADIDQRLSDVKSDLARVEKRLKALSPKVAPKSADVKQTTK
jgi:hypothetical protein